MPAAEPLTRITSTATPLPNTSVDTDVITPMPRVLDGTFVERAFESLRFDAQGNPKPNPFDDPAHANDQILVTGANFGYGSSRETAVWAIKGMGYRVLIAESFGDIFLANCFKNAMLPVVLPSEQVAHLLELARLHAPITVNVQTATVSADDHTFQFALPRLRQVALLEGLDDLDLALRMDRELADFEQQDRSRRPWIDVRSRSPRS